MFAPRLGILMFDQAMQSLNLLPEDSSSFVQTRSDLHRNNTDLIVPYSL